MSEQQSTKRDVVLNPQFMQLAEQWRQDWVTQAPEGTKLDDIMNPAFWSHVAAKLQQFDRIEVRAETGEWMADLIVLAVGGTYAAVYLDKFRDFVNAKGVSQLKEDDGFEVKWGGPANKFRVIRRSDSQVISGGHATREEAAAALAAHKRTIQTT